VHLLTPALLFGAAAAVHFYNAGHTESVLLFPFVDKIFPSTAGRPVAMGAVSVKLLAALGCVSLALQAWNARRRS
jgi:hypothetical protein